MTKYFLLFAAFLLPVVLCAEEYLGGHPFVVIEEGPSDYLVMYNSLIDDQVTLYGEGENRQGDTCINKSSFTLNPDAVPSDAEVVKAYLVWMGVVDSGKLDQPTDNAVHLKFIHKDGYIYEKDIVAGEGPKLLGDTSDPALFESAKFTAETAIGCTETEPGTATTAELAYFTYRVDVTDFFQEVKDFIAAQGTPLTGSAALPGDYTMSGLDCVQDDVYRCPTLMLSNWVIVLVYRSAEKKEKSIYLYNLFALNQHNVDIFLYDIFLPTLPKMRMTLITGEGDQTMSSDRALIHGWQHELWWYLADDCGAEAPGEIWDSYATTYSYEETQGFCPHRNDTVTFGLDVDDWHLETAPEIILEDISSSEPIFRFDFWSDELVTDLIVLSVDKPDVDFDIPPEASDWFDETGSDGGEKKSCTCSTETGRWSNYAGWCAERPMYFLIKVQNWGSEPAQRVVVVDELDAQLDYVPGSTEVASEFDQNGNGTNWRTIPDGANGEFQLAGDGWFVAETMEPCDRTTWTCTDTRLFRFKVVPKTGIPYNTTITNQAIIRSGDSPLDFLTNKHESRNWGVEDCVLSSFCPEPPKAECGGEVPDADMITSDAESNDDDILEITTAKPDGCGCSLVW